MTQMKSGWPDLAVAHGASAEAGTACLCCWSALRASQCCCLKAAATAARRMPENTCVCFGLAD